MKCNKCNVNEVPPWRKSKCDDCAKADEAAWNASKKGTDKAVEKALEVPAKPETFSLAAEGTTEPDIKPPTGEYQSLVYNKTIAPHIYKVGTEPRAGQEFVKHEIHYENVEDLELHLKKLKDAKLMVEFVLDDPFKQEN